MKRDNTPEITRNTMVKKVNIIARLPVRTLYPPIHGTYEGINMSPANVGNNLWKCNGIGPLFQGCCNTNFAKTKFFSNNC